MLYVLAGHYKGPDDDEVCNRLCLIIVICIAAGVLVLVLVVITVVIEMRKRGKLHCHQSQSIAPSTTGASMHTTVVNVGDTIMLDHGYCEIQKTADTPKPSEMTHEDPDYLHLPSYPYFADAL